MELNKLIEEMKSVAQQDRLKTVAEMIEGKTVLDAGAGVASLKSHLPNSKKYMAVDAEREFVEYIRQLQVDAIVANINKLPFEDKSFDTVVAAEIIEHLENPGIGLAECMRIAKDQVILTIPNSHSWREHAWTFEWKFSSSWIVLNIKRNLSFEKEHQEKFKQ